ncbi:hypothetical protein HK405_015851, partial [Cladochytrium tenue]
WFYNLGKTSALAVADIDEYNRGLLSDVQESEVISPALLRRCAPHLTRLRAFKYRIPVGTPFRTCEVARACYALGSLRCLQLDSYIGFSAKHLARLVDDAPPTLAHLCFWLGSFGGDVDDGQNRATASPHGAPEEEDGVTRRRIRVCLEDWDQDLADFRRRAVADATTEDDRRYRLDSHTRPSEEVWGTEDDACVRGPMFGSDGWLKLWLKAYRIS